MGAEEEGSEEEGSATIWYVGLIAGVLVVGGLLVVLVAIWSGKAGAQAGADMAALGGADLSSVAVFEGASSPSLACTQAGNVAEKNQVSLQECWVEGGDTFVVVVRQVRILGWSLDVAARARAGPALR